MPYLQWFYWGFFHQEIYKYYQIPSFIVVTVQFSRSVMSIATPLTAAHQTSQSFTICWSLLKLMSIESMMQSNHLILCHPLLLLPSIFPSIKVFSKESVLQMNIQGGFHLGLTGLISVKGTSLLPQFESIDTLVLSLLWPRSSYFSLPLATGNHHSTPYFYEIDFYFLLGST